MKLTGDSAASLELLRRSSTSDLIDFRFSCSWCAGGYELYSEPENYQKLELACHKILNGKQKTAWLSEKGDLELIFTKTSLGKIRARVICNPSVMLDSPGALDFEVDLDLASFDTVVA